MLQHNPIVEKMKKGLVGKVLGKIKELSEEDRRLFWVSGSNSALF